MKKILRRQKLVLFIFSVVFLQLLFSIGKNVPPASAAGLCGNGSVDLGFETCDQSATPNRCFNPLTPVCNSTCTACTSSSTNPPINPPLNPPPVVNPPASKVGEINIIDGYFRAGNGKYGGPCCGPYKKGDRCSSVPNNGVKGNFTPDSACQEAYPGSHAGSSLGNQTGKDFFCGAYFNDYLVKMECVSDSSTPVDPIDPTDPCAAPPAVSTKKVEITYQTYNDADCGILKAGFSWSFTRTWDEFPLFGGPQRSNSGAEAVECGLEKQVGDSKILNAAKNRAGIPQEGEQVYVNGVLQSPSAYDPACITPDPPPPPLAPPCAEWKDGTPDSGVCLKVATSLFQGKNSKSGDISTDPAEFIVKILTIILSFAGGIALLLIISAGYKMITSKGKPEGIQQGRDQLIAAIVGLVFIIFSFVIFQLVVVDILKIPGFTK